MSVPDLPAEAGVPDAAAPAGARRPPRHILIIIAGVFAVSMLKGLRMPNLWSATHMTFNYSQGFIRRGLFGQVLRLSAPLVGADRVYRYNLLALLAVILFVLAVVAMIRLVRRTLDTDGGDLTLAAMTVVFAASPGVVFLVHEIGYLDYIGLVVVPVFIGWAARTRSLWAPFYVATAISVVLALVHESMIIMFAPTLWLVLVAHIVTQARARALSRRTVALLFAHAAAAAAVALIASSAVGTLGTKSPAQIHLLQASIQRLANFPLRGDGFEALYRPVRENLMNLMPLHWRYAINQRYLITGLVVSFPGLAVLSTYALRLIARLALPRAIRALLTTLFLVATLCPLALNLVGWDSARWNAICFAAAFSCIAALRLFFCAPGGAVGVQRPRLDDRWMLVLAAGAIVFALASNYYGFLFDGYVVQWFPFDSQLQSLVELFRGGFTFVPRL
jgi:hypothetical protein